MNRLELRTRVRSALFESDSTNTHFSDTTLNNLLDDWQEDIATWSKWPRAEAIVAGGSVVDQRGYTIDTDKVMQILFVWFDNAPKDFINEEYLNEKHPSWRTDGSGTPLFAYMIDTNVLGFYPKPDTAAKEVRIKYVRRPTPFADDTTSPDLPGGYHATAIPYCVSMAHASVGNGEQSSYFYKMYIKERQDKTTSIKLPEKRDGWSWVGDGR